MTDDDGSIRELTQRIEILDRTVFDLTTAMGRAKVDRWQATTGDTDASEPGDAPPDGFEPAGPWEPIGAGLTNGRVNGGPEDMESFLYWRRPLRRVTT